MVKPISRLRRITFVSIKRIAYNTVTNYSPYIMAVPKDKIKASLDTRYRGKSLSKHFKEQFAEKAAELIEDESGIEDYINAQEFIINLSMSESDRRATEAAQKAKQDAANAVTGTKEENTTETQTEDPNMPEWAKGLMNKLTGMESKITGFEQAGKQKTIEERFRTEATKAGIPEAWIKRSIPQDEATFDATLTELQADYTQFATENKIQAFSAVPAAAGAKPTGNGDKVKPATQEEVAEVLKQI